MTEKLIIKNFGPVKSVELDLKKINVFIGPNASGKSIVSKIISIVKSGYISKTFIRNKVIDELFDFFNIRNFFNESSLLQFETEIYKIFKTFSEEKPFFLKDIGYINNENAENYIREKLKLYKTAFIPTERLFYSTISSSIMGLITNDISLPKFFTLFGSNFEVARKRFQSNEIDFLKVKYDFENNTDFITSVDGNKILLSESASSIQSVIPMYMVIKYITDEFKRSHLVIEEPELNLFPNTQKDLVNFLIENTYKNNNSLTINTHSPYILMALNNLIEGNNILKQFKNKGTGEEKFTEYEEKIKEILKSKKLIDFNDIAVYYIREDGTAEDIKDYENKLINAGKIDSVSDIFADEVDALFELK